MDSVNTEILCKKWNCHCSPKPMMFAKGLATSILGRRCLASKQGPRCSQVRHSSPLSRSCQESNSNLTQFQTSISAVWGRAILVLSTRLCGQRGIQLWESFPAENELPRENSPNNNESSLFRAHWWPSGRNLRTSSCLKTSWYNLIFWYYSNFCSRLCGSKCECLSINTAYVRVRVRECSVTCFSNVHCSVQWSGLFSASFK